MPPVPHWMRYNCKTKSFTGLPAVAVFHCAPSRENAKSAACPILLYSNNFSAEYAQSKAEGIPNRPTSVQGGKPGCTAGAQPAVQQ